MVNLSEEMYVRTVNELVERNRIIAEQQTMLDERQDMIERLFKLVDTSTVMLQERAATITKLTGTIKWLHEQIQEMDDDGPALG